MKRKSFKHSFFKKIPFLMTAACLGLMVYAAVYGEPFNISHEDGLLEWGSVYFYLVCAGLSLLALKTNFLELEKRQKIFLAIFAIILIFGAGEEISWGQRLFEGSFTDSETKESDALIQLGHGDTSIHNIRLNSKYVRFSIGSMLFGVALLFGLMIHGIWLPIAKERKNQKALKLIRVTGVFIPPLRLGILAFSVALVFHYLKRATDLTQTREYKEFLLPFIYCMMVVHCYFMGKGRLTDRIINSMIVITGLWIVGSLYFFLLRRG